MTTAAVTVFETFLEQDGPQDAKPGGDGEKFRLSERQRVRRTAVASWFCELRGNLVSNAVMLPFILLKTHFAFFAVLQPYPRHFFCLSLSKLQTMA